MANTIQTWAPWMNKAEAASLISQIQAMPPHERRPTAEALGKRLNVINAERERLGLRTIAPADMTKRQFAEYRKAKQRMRQKLYRQRKRRHAGYKIRDNYVASSLTKQKPWKAEGISRATWYRRQPPAAPKPVRQVCLPINSFNTVDTPVSRRTLHRPKRATAVQGLTPSKTTDETTSWNTLKTKH
jgi:hypothetical protein